MRHALERPRFGHHAGDLVLDEPELADRPTEGAALLATLDGHPDYSLAHAHAAARKAQPAAVHDLHRHLESPADLPQDVFGRHTNVAELELRRGTPPNAELGLAGAGLHARPAVDHECRDPRLDPILRSRCTREDREDVGDAAVGHPDLGAVEDVGAIRLELCPGLDLTGVAAGAGLRQGESRDLFARGQGGEVTLPLLLGAEQNDSACPQHLVRAEGQGQAHVEAGDFLQDAPVAGGAEPQATVGLGQAEAEAPQPLEPHEDLFRDALLAVDLGGVDPQLEVPSYLVEEGVDGVLLGRRDLRPGKDEGLFDGAEEEAPGEGLFHHGSFSSHTKGPADHRDEKTRQFDVAGVEAGC